MSVHLTNRFWMCIAIGWLSVALSMVSASLPLLVFGLPFLFAIAFSLADQWWPESAVKDMKISSPRVVEGDTVVFTFTVDLPRPALTDIEVQLPPSLVPLGPARFVSMIHHSQTFEVPMKAIRWGATSPEWVTVSTQDRLGITERLHRVSVWEPVRVHPPSERLKSLVPLYRERAVSGEHKARAKGSGTELAEVRAYQYGDPIRMIHPTLSARLGTPMVIERHPERSSQIVLMVDSAQDLGVDLATTLRWTVTAAMALSERHLNAQDRVGLLDAGKGVRWLPARLGRRHLHQVIDALLATEVMPRDKHTRSQSLPNDLPRSATIVAISPLINENMLTKLVELRSRGHEMLVIKPSNPPPDSDPSLLAMRIFRVGNELNQRWLQDRGVTIVPWQSGEPLDQVIRSVIGNLGRVRQALR